MEDKEYTEFLETNWKDIWEPILFPDGKLDLEALKKEIFDFSNLIDNTTTVYHVVSGGKLSYPTYSSEIVLDAYKEHLEELTEYWEEDFRECNNCICGK